MAQIRAMFPAFFDRPPVAPPVWGACEWLDLWNWNSPATDEGYGHFHGAEPHHLSPDL